jgi:hypothetical protein
MNPMTMKGANRMRNKYAVDGMILCKYSMIILQVRMYIYGLYTIEYFTPHCLRNINI